MFRDDAENVIRRELNGNESLLWSGRPRQGVFLRPADAFLIPFSLLWGGFAFFWEMSVVRSHAPFFFTLWGIPFVLMGVYVIIGRFFYDAKQRENTYYGVTNERVLIVLGIRSRTVKSLPLRTLSDVTLAESRDGRGTITFGPASLFSRGWNAFTWPGMASWPGGSSQVTPAFESVTEPRSLYETIRAAQRADDRR